MNFTKHALALIVAGMAFGGSQALAENANVDGDAPPAKKNTLAGPKAEGGKRLDRPGPMAEQRANIMEAMRDLLKDLELTEDQKVQIKSIMEEAKGIREDFMEEHGAELDALREKMKEAREAKDREQMKQLADELRAIMEAGPKPEATVNKIKEVLTPEQREKFDDRVAEFKEKHPRPEPGERPEGKKRKPKAEAAE